MLAIIVRLDGANAAMFHMEHCGNRAWQYQCRWPDSRNEKFREWGALRSASGEAALEPLADPTVICEIRWRWADVIEGIVQGEDEPWQDAVPHEWAGTTAEFHVITKRACNFQPDPILHACAMVRGRPVAFELVMPRRVVAAEGVEILSLHGTAIGMGPSTVLREAGEFVSTGDGFSISNAGESQVTLLPVMAKLPEFVPVAVTYAVRHGALPPEEVALLMAYVANRESTTADPEL